MRAAFSRFRNAALASSGFAALSLFSTKAAFAHCQVPCGIYDDSGRINTLLEDCKTITKAMNQVNSLSPAKNAQSMNQATRWIITKEAHASNIITILAEYFLTQKVANVSKYDEGYPAYLEILATHHRVMRLAMKAKQSTDLKVAEDLAHEISHLATIYKKK